MRGKAKQTDRDQKKILLIFSNLNLATWCALYNYIIQRMMMGLRMAGG